MHRFAFTFCLAAAILATPTLAQQPTPPTDTPTAQQPKPPTTAQAAQQQRMSTCNADASQRNLKADARQTYMSGLSERKNEPKRL